jgi:CYTH domain-containing protein
MYDIIFVSKVNSSSEWISLKEKYPLAKHVDSFEKAQRIALTEFFWLVPDDVIISNFEFDYVPDFWSMDVAHVFKNKDTYDGIALIPKNSKITVKEIEHRFYVNKKEVDIVASVPKSYDVFEIDSYDQYLSALATSTTDMFWMSSTSINANYDLIDSYYISHHDTQLKNQTHAFIHTVGEQRLYNGLFLCSKQKTLSKHEVEYRFPVNRYEHDTVGSTIKYYDVFEIDSYDEYLAALKCSSTELFWMSSANITVQIPDVYFTHDNEYDRKQNHVFIHRVGDRDLYNGVFLCNKHRPLTQKEVDHRFLVNAKEWDIVASGPKTYDVFEIDSYNEYLNAVENSTTELFWMSSKNITADIPNLYFTHDNEYDRKQNHAFIHRVGDRDLYNGVFLCSKHRPLTEKEVDHRFLVNAKEWDIVASGPCKYDTFYPTTYDDYLNALKISKTEMFWIIPDYVDPTSRFKFDTYFSHDEQYSRKINHVYLNGKYYDGIVLCSKHAKFSRREFDYKFISAKKEINIVISTPKPYDIVFISYQETAADENHTRLLNQFPNVKRIHGVKGIHAAHIAAAKLCNTDMFWIVDADAIILDDFKFDYQVPRWDKEVVHVWRSQNPINDMVYGYGGVKLFPTELTINMDITKTDMTTSVSSKFQAMPEISNITKFNTDPFNTWKSAFRECVKLSSKVIDRQKDDETLQRLNIWCTVGENRQYGKYAIAGAVAGAEYGSLNQDNLIALKLINDFNWLKEQFDAQYS